jgi:ABC-type phosphate transport system substrate-binding protein
MQETAMKGVLAAALLIVLACGFAAGPRASAQGAAAAKGVVVIVNSGCPDDRATGNKLQASDIKSIFLLDTTKWSDKDKTAIVTYPMVSDSDEAKLFLKKVIGKSEDELAKHWAKLKEDDGVEQPKGRKTNADVFKLVSKDKATGGIGYVSKSYFDGLPDDDKKKVKSVYEVTDN